MTDTKTAQSWFEEWGGKEPTNPSKRWNGWHTEQITYREFAKRAWESDTDFVFGNGLDAWDREMKADFEHGLLDGVLERARKAYENGDTKPLP